MEASREEATPEARLVEDIVQSWRRKGAWPRVEAFRLEHPEDVEAFEGLLAEGLLLVDAEHCRPTLEAFLRFGPEAELAGFDWLLPSLKEAWRRNRGKAWTAEELGDLSGLPSVEVAQILELFASELDLAEVLFGDEQGLVGAIQLSPSVLEAERFASVRARLSAQGPLEAPVRLSELRVDGYRVLEGLDARLGPLTVLTGAPGSGKSSLLDSLALLSSATRQPLPPDEVDPRGAERLQLSLRVTSGPRRAFRYAVELGASTGEPQVLSERFTTLEVDARGQDSEPFTLLDFKEGRGTVRTATWARPRPRQLTVSRTLPPNTLALRGELDSSPRVVDDFRAFVSSWRFYPGFEVSRSAASRRPVLTEPEPLLAVLFHLMVEHPARWAGLQSHLREIFPSFLSLSVKPRGGPGTVLGVWREAGVDEELTLADLSDGLLRFLCLAALCVSPRKAPLLCLDGPEVGLHPRMLPGLAALLRGASTESQVLVATQSPALLRALPPEAVALLKRVEGRVVFSWPASEEELRRELDPARE
jgi:predicted ATPase